MAEIEFAQTGAVGRILLNAPQRLNALSEDMCAALGDQLAVWRADDSVRCVVIEGAGERAFCAGGDIRDLYVSHKAGEIERLKRFFRTEYRADWRTAQFPKPYIAILDGVVMGGGVGVSCHGRYRIATERSLFAMPECAIGFHPDVGASHLLPRLPGRAGRYLALTGARAGAADMLGLGIATHHIPSDRMPDFLAALAAVSDWLDGADEVVESLLESFHEVPAGPAPVIDARHEIDADFDHDRVEDILAALDARGGDWAAGAAKALRALSPTALKAGLMAQIHGEGQDFATCLAYEFRLTCAFLNGAEFIEGVRAQVIDKDRAPRWSPATLAGVDDAAIAAMAEPTADNGVVFDWDAPCQPR